MPLVAAQPAALFSKNTAPTAIQTPRFQKIASIRELLSKSRQCNCHA